MKLFKLNLDYFGIGTSIFCAIHCLVTPIILILLPFASLAFLEEEYFEIGILVVSLFIASISFVSSYFQKHKKVLPIILASIGFSLFISGKVVSWENTELIFSIVGGGFVVIAHYYNLRLIKKNAVL